MKHPKWHLWVSLLTWALIAQGQAQNPFCHFDIINHAIAQDPDDRAVQEGVNREIQNYLLHHGRVEGAALNTLPVVLHVVSPPGTPIGSGNNLTLQQINTGLNNLNDLLANAGMFQASNGVDTEIELCLAKRDPYGSPTSGVTRTYSNLVDENICAPGFDANNDVPLKTQVPSWDCDRYINVWLVTNMFRGGGCGLAGYAYFPGANCNVDGIVVESVYWNDPATIFIVAHELGHYLGLYHTFQGGCVNNDCMTDGDRVCDTPPDGSMGFAPCDVNSCDTDVPDLEDDNENIMDYSNCKPVHFTQGQKDRMKATLESVRLPLTLSQACAPVVGLDAGIADVYFENDVCDDTFCITVIIRNEGYENLTSLDIEWKIDVNPTQIFPWVGNLSVGQSDTVHITCLPLNPGTYEITVYLSRPNAGVDEFPANNTLVRGTTLYAPLVANIKSIQAARCKSDGRVEFEVLGGSPNYTFLLGNGRPLQTSPIFDLMTKGDYSVTITDRNNCELVVDFEIPDSCKESVPRNFVLNGDARYNGDHCYLLVDDRVYRSGSMWYEELVNLEKDVIVDFQMNLGCRDANGADGIAFVFQPISTNIGANGGGLGYADINPSVAVEFDTWQNGNYNDPVYDHIAIMPDGIISHPGLTGTVPIVPGQGNAEDCNWRNVQIIWSSEEMTLDVYVECQLAITYQGDIVKDQLNNDPNVYFGFTAATGGATNVHQVCLNYINVTDRIGGDTICLGENTEISAPSVFNSYQWTPTRGVSNPGIFNPVFSPDTTTTYYVRMKNDCTEFLDSVKIVVVSLEIDSVTTLPDSCGLVGNEVTIHVSNPDPFLEYSIDGLNYQRSHRFTANPGLNTAYIRLGRCVETQIFEVVQTPDLRDSILVEFPETCKDLGLFIVTGIEGNPDYQYRLVGGVWKNDGRFEGLSAGVYFYQVRDTKGCLRQGRVVIPDFTGKRSIVVDSSDLVKDCCDSMTYISVSTPGSSLTRFTLDGTPMQTSGTFRNLSAGRHFITGTDDLECPVDTIWFEVLEYTDKMTSIEFVGCLGMDTTIHGKIYNAEGQFTDTIVQGRCCDSILHIHVVINDIPVVEQRVEVCEGQGVLVGNHYYDKGGTYMDTFSTAGANCDSIVSTELVVHLSPEENYSHKICEGEVLDLGYRQIRQGGIYLDTFSTINGCDCVIVNSVDLFVLDTTRITEKGCQGFSVQVGNNQFSQTGNYTVVLTNQNGCDSLVYLDLEVYPRQSVAFTMQLCPGKEIEFEGQTFTETGMYEFKYLSQNGCDSVVTLTIDEESDRVCDSLRKIYIPNVFTPNGDQINDRFTLFGNEELETILILEIYSRWGELIYRGENLPPNDVNDGWDGTFNGEEMLPGVYVYRAEVEFQGSIRKSYSGDLTLSR